MSTSPAQADTAITAGIAHEGQQPQHVLLFNHDDVTNCIIRSQEGGFEYSVTTLEGATSEASAASLVTTVNRGDVVG